MPGIDHKAAYRELRDGVLKGIQSHFPIKGGIQTIELRGLEVKNDDMDSDDIRAQHEARNKGETWASTVYGIVTLKDNVTGNVISERKMRLAEIPQTTKRLSYIVGGKEYQIDHQWQLKPGVYVKRSAAGNLEAKFNIPSKRSFNLNFDPDKKTFMMARGTSKAIPIYPIMKAMGVADDDMEKSWGKEIFAANRTAKLTSTGLERFYKADKKKAPASKEEAAEYVVKELTESPLHAESTKLTLGKPYDHVSGDVLHLATSKMLAVHSGAAEDDRDSILHKDLRSAGDFAYDKLTSWETNNSIRKSALRKMTAAKDVREVIHFDMFNKPVLQTFQKNEASRHASQVNPIEMLASAQQTTIMGPGGVQSQHAIDGMVNAKYINPSTMGFIDPVRTPESEKSGVILRLPSSVKKIGKEVFMPLHNMKTGVVEFVSPLKFGSSTVLLPDQVTWKGGKPIQKPGKAIAADKSKLSEVNHKDADYVMLHPSQLFSVTTNLIPFLGNNSGNRATYAGQHIEQAISLKGRDAPLVQVGSPTNKEGLNTFEKIFGQQSSHTASISGVVTHVKKDGITIKGADGKSKEVQLYNNYPLNDPKSLMHSTPTVAVGDKVKQGQHIADTNFTKGGAIALGTNLRVGYLPYKGYNFEDGVVISESAAKKLTSEHLHKPEISIEKNVETLPQKFILQHHDAFSRDQMGKLDGDGVVRIGQKVTHGDPLVLAMRPFQAKDREGVGAIGRAMSGKHSDISLRWHNDVDGEVVAVNRDNKKVVVHVRTLEPMVLGDKISGRHGNKGICFDAETQVLTTSGWKYFKDVTDADDVCTLNRSTHDVEYQRPIRHVAYEHVGKMYRFSGRRLNLMTTPEHRHFVRKPKSHEYVLESAESCFGQQRIHLRTGSWSGTELQTITIPGRDRRQGTKDRHEFCEPRDYDADDFLEFFGYWVTEGSSGNDSHITLGQRLAVNPDTYEAMVAVLQRMGYEPYQGPDSLVISDPRLHAWLQKFGSALEKYIPREFLAASKRQLKTLADAIFAGDGGVYFNEKCNHTRHELFTSSSKLADDYQELALKLGMSANIKSQDRKDRDNIEYVVRWSLKDEVYTTKDSRYESRVEEWVDYSGMVYCVEVPNHVIYVRRGGIPVWSGNCTLIIPDAEMPHTKDGRHIEVALNPAGVPGRMNVGQVLETAASKIAEKTGKTYIVDNFSGASHIEKVQAELKAHGLSDQEELFDPATGKSIGGALVGTQHMIKLMHTIDKKSSSRSGMSVPGSAESPVKYDNDFIPSHGGKTGGMAIGALDVYTLLAHGAKANLREIQTWKSEGPDNSPIVNKRWDSQHKDVWQAIMDGGTLPVPRSTFSFQKFTDLLRATGVNVEKKGHQIQLTPLTNRQILDMSNGEIKNPGEVTYPSPDKYGDPRVKRGGIFDETVTGGHGGRKWGHIALAEPVPNPMFEKAISSLTGIKRGDYRDVVTGKKAITKEGKIVALDTPGSSTGGPGIVSILSAVDVDRDLKAAKKELDGIQVKGSIAHGASTSVLDASLKKVKYLSTLQMLNMKPTDAYILKNLPVIPPIMRPISVLSTGSIKWDDLNHLYEQFGVINTSMKDPSRAKVIDGLKVDQRAEYYDGIKALMGLGTVNKDKKIKGIIEKIHGEPIKTGYFQGTLMSRRQDMSLRSTIVPEPSLGLDEVGLPKHLALNTYKPFVIRKLVEMGAAGHKVEAFKLLQDPVKNDKAISAALNAVVAERPILLKRDPALHRHSIQGFTPKIISGKAVQIHPLTTSGFNADFDGDSMSAYVPISKEAVEEAYRMMPSRNLYSEASGRIAFSPTHEGALGLYKLSHMDGKHGGTFKDPVAVLSAVNDKKLTINQPVNVGGITTTAGRLLLAQALPTAMHADMLSNPDSVIDKNGLNKLFTTIAKDHKSDFGEIVNRLKDLGNGATYGLIPIFHGRKGEDAIRMAENQKSMKFVSVNTHSLSLKDFDPDTKTRGRVLGAAQKSVNDINDNVNMSKLERERRVVETWVNASDKMDREHLEGINKNPNNLSIMLKSGIKPGMTQYKQLVLAPVMMADATGKAIPVPIKRSYSEGLDVAGYWTQQQGARRGTVMKVQEVRDPGTFSKRMINTAMGLVVTDHDCGTDGGIALHVTDKDVHDRILAKDFHEKGVTFTAGTTITPQVAGAMRSADKNAKVMVRSPMKCEHAKGLCQLCSGLNSDGELYPLGSNVGVMAAQSIGERSVQLTMKAFHCLHGQSIILVRRDGVVEHTTLERLFGSIGNATVDAGEHTGVAEEVSTVQGVEVWDNGGWVAVEKVMRHVQQPGTAMAAVRSRSGYMSVSQDNHPHMLRANSALCEDCGTLPKHSNGGRQYYCRKCCKIWTEILDDAETFMVSPSEISRSSHRATLDTGPAPSSKAEPVKSGWLAGIYCAEGSVQVRNKNGVPYPCAIQISQLPGAIYSKIGEELHTETGKRGEQPRYHQVYGVDLAREWLEMFGPGASSKGLPDGWSGYSDVWLADFVSGVIDGDGTLKGSDDSKWMTCRIDTTSFLLAQQVHHILRKLGMFSRVVLTTWRECSLNQGMAVCFTVTEQAKRVLSASLKLLNVHGKPSANAERFEDVVDYVSAFKFLSPPVVYDIKTSSGTFYVNGMWTHNSGGVVQAAGSSSRAVGDFDRVQQLTQLFEHNPNEAVLAMKGGKIDKIDKESAGSRIWIGGVGHHVGKDVYGAALHENTPHASAQLGYKTWSAPKVGDHVDAGHQLSDPNRTLINPRTLYKATNNMERVQNLMVDELHGIYGSDVRRQHIETAVRAMGDLTKVRDPGDAEGILKGEFHSAAYIRSINRGLIKAGKSPVVHSPTLKGVETLPLSASEDWMAKMQHTNISATLLNAAAMGHKTDIHGVNPIPGVAYGAELGLTSEHSGKPGYGHLKDVRKHGY